MRPTSQTDGTRPVRRHRAPRVALALLATTVFAFDLSGSAVAGEPGTAKPTGPAAGLEFTSWESAIATAKREGRLVFAHFTASWCKPCKRLKSEVYTQPALQKRLVDFARAEVDTENGVGRELWMKLKADSLPVATIFDADGVELKGARIVGVQSVDEIVTVLDDVLERQQDAQTNTEKAAKGVTETAQDRAEREKVRGGEWQTRDTSWLADAMLIMVGVLGLLVVLFTVLKMRRNRRQATS